MILLLRIEDEGWRGRGREKGTGTGTGKGTGGTGETHERQPDVDQAVSQEPMQEGAVGGHHVRVLFRLLRGFVAGRQRWAGVLARWRPVEAGWVRGRVEFGGLFERARFGVGGGFVGCGSREDGGGGEESWVGFGGGG